MKNFIQIENSSNLEAYDHEINNTDDTKTLYIKFKNGGIYMYLNVPSSLIAEFAVSTSKGAFLAKEIKGKFECVKIHENNPENSY